MMLNNIANNLILYLRFTLFFYNFSGSCWRYLLIKLWSKAAWVFLLSLSTGSMLHFLFTLLDFRLDKLFLTLVCWYRLDFLQSLEIEYTETPIKWNGMKTKIIKLSGGGMYLLVLIKSIQTEVLTNFQYNNFFPAIFCVVAFIIAISRFKSMIARIIW